jgi:hydrogenase expression/formation protein HypE
LSDRIVIAHGGGGELTDLLIRERIRPRFDMPDLDDSAVLDEVDGRLALTTDGYVVNPLAFPGGDIGRLAVCGTVNDLAVSGAEPRWLTLSLVLEEGLSLEVLERMLDSARAAAEESGVKIVAGDTKVVPRGLADGMYLNTAGVGVFRREPLPGAAAVRSGDVLLVSGTIADHGIAVMLSRSDQPRVRSVIESDVAPLGGLIAALLLAAPGVKFLRDPTRGGVAGVVADLAAGTGLGVVLDESRIPVRSGTEWAAELLGLDPLTVANEGKVVAVVAEEDAESALAAMRGHRYGEQAAVIGRFTDRDPGLVVLETKAGGSRIVGKPYGEELPRIC